MLYRVSLRTAGRILSETDDDHEQDQRRFEPQSRYAERSPSARGQRVGCGERRMVTKRHSWHRRHPHTTSARHRPPQNGRYSIEMTMSKSNDISNIATLDDHRALADSELDAVSGGDVSLISIILK